MVLKVTVYVDHAEFYSVGPGQAGYNHLWRTARKEGTTEQLVLAFIDTVQQISAKLKEHTASAEEESAAARFMVDMGTVVIETLPVDNVTERSEGLKNNASTEQLPESDSSQGLPSPSGSASTEDTFDKHTDVQFVPGCQDTLEQEQIASDTKVSLQASSTSKQSPSKRHVRSLPITVGENDDIEEVNLQPRRQSRRLKTPAKRSYLEDCICSDEDHPDSEDNNDSDESDEAEKTPKGRRYKSRPILKGWKSKDSPRMSHPFMCEICGAGFVRKMMLRDHMCSKHEYTKDESDAAVAKVYGNRGGGIRNLGQFKVPDKLFYPDEVEPGKTSDDASERELKPKPMCPKCGSVFGNITNAQIHFEMECAKSPLHCDICGCDYESIGGYKVHMESHRNKQNGVEFKCKTCGKVVYHQYVLSTHEAKHTRDHMCDICGQGFAQKITLDRHRNGHTKEMNFACTLCPKVYYNKKSLSAHIYMHHKASQIACHICGKVVNERKLNNHIRSAHSESDKVECQTCNTVFKNKYSLKGHVKEVHQAARKFPCTWPECDKIFVRKRDLVAHTNMHKNVKRFSCEICSKKFRNKNHLLNHTNWHNGVRPHQCNICEKSFLIKGNLTKHLVTHRNKHHVSSPKPINVSSKTEAQTITTSATPCITHNVSQNAPHGVSAESHDVSQVAPQSAYHGVHDVASNVSQVLQNEDAPQDVNPETITVFFTV